VWTSVSGVFTAAQNTSTAGTKLAAANGSPVVRAAPRLRVKFKAGSGAQTLYVDSVRVRAVTATRYDMEVTGFGVPVGGVDGDGQPTLPLFTDILEPEDLARRVLGSTKGVLGGEDKDNPMWMLSVGFAYAEWPLYLWTAFKEYRLDPKLAPHRELPHLASMLGEPLSVFSGLTPDERRTYVSMLLDLQQYKGSSYCVTRLCHLMGYLNASVLKIQDDNPDYRWHFVVYLNGRISAARKKTLTALIDHWKAAWMSYDLLEGSDPWILDVSELDHTTALADNQQQQGD
jgi:hypothetical protein